MGTERRGDLLVGKLVIFSQFRQPIGSHRIGEIAMFKPIFMIIIGVPKRKRYLIILFEKRVKLYVCFRHSICHAMTSKELLLNTRTTSEIGIVVS